jgi:hypothetical protein
MGLTWAGCTLNAWAKPEKNSDTYWAQNVDEARIAISAQVQQHYYQYVLMKRWNSSRLSLLTRAFDSAGREQIYIILARYCRVGIEMANLVILNPRRRPLCP